MRIRIKTEKEFIDEGWVKNPDGSISNGGAFVWIGDWKKYLGHTVEVTGFDNNNGDERFLAGNLSIPVNFIGEYL